MYINKEKTLREHSATGHSDPCQDSGLQLLRKCYILVGINRMLSERQNVPKETPGETLFLIFGCHWASRGYHIGSRSLTS